MERVTKLAIVMLALMLASSLVATEARNLREAQDNTAIKPQTFPPFDRLFPMPTGGAGSSFGMPRFGLGGASPITGSSSLPGFSWPGFGVPSGGHAATNQEKP